MRKVIYFLSNSHSLNMQVESEMETELKRVIPPHFKLFYLLSIVLFLLISFHPIFKVLPHPVTVKGTITNSQLRYTFTSARYGKTRIYGPTIAFSYRNREYAIAGGADERFNIGEGTTVIFNQSTPENALEFSPGGLLDYGILGRAFTGWLFLSGLILAFASADDHFALFSFRFRKLKLRPFLFISASIILMPFLRYTDLFLFGKKTDCVVTKESELVGYSYYNVITYLVQGTEFRTHNEYLNNDDTNIGKHYSLLYLSHKPERCVVFSLFSIYTTFYFAAVVILLILMGGWYFASTVPD